MPETKEMGISYIAKVALSLFVIVFVSVLLLAFVNYVTKDVIAKMNTQLENEARAAVLPAASSFEQAEFESDGIVEAVYTGLSGDKAVGYCVTVAPDGYGGPIRMMVGVDDTFSVTGIQITESSETAGLGAKASEAAFLNQFAGKTEGVSVVKSGTPGADQISAISGATITSRAVADGVNQAVLAAKQIAGGALK